MSKATIIFIDTENGVDVRVEFDPPAHGATTSQAQSMALKAMALLQEYHEKMTGQETKAHWEDT